MLNCRSLSPVYAGFLVLYAILLCPGYAALLDAQTFQSPLDPFDSIIFSVDPPNENDYATYNTTIANYYHAGIDMKSETPETGPVPMGNWTEYTTLVKASAKGKVVAAYATSDTEYRCGGVIHETLSPGPGTENRGLGNVVVIKHDNGVYSLYGHLDCINASISLEGSVSQGTTIIGKMGHSGTNGRRDSRFGQHLHFEIKAVESKNPSPDKHLGDTVSGTYWGYTPDLPTGYGFRDPREFIFPFSPVALTPTPVRIVDGVNGYLNVRAGPGKSYAKLTKVKVGHKFVADQKVGSGSELWYRIYLPNAGGITTGWIARTHSDCANSMCATEEPSAGHVVVTDKARLHISPGTLSHKITVHDILGQKRGQPYQDVYVWPNQHFVTEGSPQPGVDNPSNVCASNRWYKIYLPDPDNPYVPTPTNAQGWICGDLVSRVIFRDDMESGPGNWLAEFPWGQITSSWHSPTHSWTDSPGGNYSNNANFSLVSPPLDFSGLSSVTLTFWHRYDLEEGRDFGSVWVTTDALPFTLVASYTGTQETWAPATLNLDAFAGQSSVRIYFQLWSNETIRRDGWYIDDVIVREGRDTVVTHFTPGWNLFSVPLDPIDRDPSEVLCDDLSPCYPVWRWDVSLDDYVPNPNILPGQSYWIEAENDTSVDAHGSLVGGSHLVQPLPTGWHMIGQPFNFSVKLLDLSIHNNATEGWLSLREAAQLKYVDRWVYFLYKSAGTIGYYAVNVINNGVFLAIWNPETEQWSPWEKQLTSGNLVTVNPWSGFWIKSYFNSNLLELPALPTTPFMLQTP